MRPTFIIAAASIAALTIAGKAQAQANRTFVSGFGSDANPCSLSAPCRSFAGAITKTNAGGEILVLDSAGYGSVTITKSISINAPDGIEGGVTVTSGDAITITTGASDVVNLRGLTLLGGGVGSDGIAFTNLGALNIQNCVIRGFLVGSLLEPTGTAAFNVSDTVLSNNDFGIDIQSGGAGTVTAVFNRVQAIGSISAGFLINGVNSTGAVNITIANSAATNNNQGGIDAESSIGAASTQVVVTNTVVSNNGTAGLSVNGDNAVMFVGKNTITGNTAAFLFAGGSTLFSFGDNEVKGNTNDGGAIPLVATK